MVASGGFLSARQAASRLGVSAKALRLYERAGLIGPDRTAAGWRAYGPKDLERAAEIVSLRAVGLALADVARVLKGASDLPRALAAHEARLEAQAARLAGTLKAVRRLRGKAGRGPVPAAVEPACEPQAGRHPGVAFDLPWPWGGERFALRDIAPLNYITGPLGSGKTRLARRLAETLPGAEFLGLERLAEGGAAARARLDADPALASRVERALASLVAQGACRSHGLTALLAALEREGAAPLVVDMVEQGLDGATQRALVSRLRRRTPPMRILFLLTRSSSILDLDAVGEGEIVILCPANHSPPTCVAPRPGTAGYEAVATCLASPEVRARTAGVIAWRPQAA